MQLDIGLVEVLLLVSAFVAIIARRFKLPYTTGLVIAGVAMAFVPLSSEIKVSKELIFSLFLPPLIFEAAFMLDWKELKADALPIVVMSSLGLLMASGVVAAGFIGFLGWDWRPAAVFAALICATDPVSIIASFKEVGFKGRLRILVEGESLLNDGVAAALFVIALSLASGVSVTPLAGIGQFVLVAFGGLSIGIGVGWACVYIIGKAEDHLVEITLSCVAAFGSFLTAEHFGASGVLATLAAGLVISNVGSLHGLTAKGRENAESFWEFVAFIANSIVFLLMGLRLAREHYANVWVDCAAGVLLVLLGRAVAVYGSCLLVRKNPISPRFQHLMVWGGLRGALALALALAIPESVPRQQDIVAVTFAVVAFSVLVQGTTIGPLMRKSTGELPAMS